MQWLRAALADLDGEMEYLAREDRGAAVSMYAAIREKIELLRQFPQAGRPGRVPGTRELVMDQHPYIVPYRVRDNTVEILRVFHTSRKEPKEW